MFGSSAALGYMNWQNAKKRFDAELGEAVKPWQVHDIRRTVATRMADIGIAPHIIEACLNHYGGHRAGVAGVYNRSTYEREVRNALAQWAEHVAALAEGRGAKVVNLRGAT